ncbi:MAG TPA: primosomal protein N' [Vicinamibacteria bacterium]|nr:primosomal protein N' [Vicinamibacteria bacterium]
MSRAVVSVALPLPFQSCFSYLLPGDQPAPDRGIRVLVPFGPRRVIGVVTGPGERPEGLELKEVLSVLDEAPLPTQPLLDLAAWVADYYLAPPGECYRLVIPPAGVRASRAVVRLLDPERAAGDPLVEALRAGPLRLSTLAKRLDRDPGSRLARLRTAGVVAVEQDLEAPGFRLVRIATLVEQAPAVKGKAQVEIVRRLAEAGGQLRVPDLVRDRPSLRAPLAALVKAGAVALAEERETRTPAVLAGGVSGRMEPSADQVGALRAVEDAVLAGGYRPFLLHGVTGSGKTEVYFRAAEKALAAGRGALILVPEIALTPMLVRAAAARFGATVAVMHSDLSAGERHDQWWRVREGEARVVVGARSAVFAPLPDLGLLVVDEEHEGSYKQDESPRYHGRDVAVVRAKLEGATVILGSATPSVESHTNALKGKYQRIELPTRIGSQGLPQVEIVDRRQAMKAGADPILTPVLREALALRLERREQSLLLLNRRGYAVSLLCRECGSEAACPNCSVSLALHYRAERALCHYCGFERRTPEKCAACNGEYLRLAGYGTEKVVEGVRAALPAARVERLDRDLASRRGYLERTLAAFESGEIDILVGTQMIAKGHDFPRVTLVGVVDADVGLGLPDFRAAERSFQLLTQVAGRAGRADLAGEVILQSHWPDHYALRLACSQDYPAFYEREMEFRRTMGYPPTTALVNLILRSRDAQAATEGGQALARRLREAAGGRYRILGPASAPLARIKQEHRVQVLLKGQRTAMREAVRSALVELYGSVRWPGVAVDVDPVSVM